MRVRLVGVLTLSVLASLSPKPAIAQEGGAAGPRIANLAGARDRPGLFTQRLVLPAGFCSPLHTHDGDLHGLVMRGALLMGQEDSAGRLDVREYPAGSFVPVAAGRRHVEGSAVETEVHLSWIGPLRTVALDSARPERCTPGKHD